MFSNYLSFIFCFSGFYLKDLWFYIHLLLFLYFSLSDTSFDFDSSMIFLKYAFTFLFTGIIGVYLVYLLDRDAIVIFIKNISYFPFLL